MLFFLNYLKTWKVGIKKSLVKKRLKLRLLSSKRAKESEETSLKVAVCKKCGLFANTLHDGKPAPLIYCTRCKNRNDFDIGTIPFKKLEEIRIEY